ncbi:MAG: hypothetical protein Q4B69_00575 [Slackia sp.]|nr:hypothetical protein [Slackia sp.]
MREIAHEMQEISVFQLSMGHYALRLKEEKQTTWAFVSTSALVGGELSWKTEIFGE